MGWLNRLKLNSLPIVNDMEMIKTTMAMLGGSNPSEVMKIDAKLKNYSDTELRKKYSKVLLSLAQTDAYLIDDGIQDKGPCPSLNLNIRSSKCKWKLCNHVLVKFDISLGFISIPEKFIVKIDPTTWEVYDIPIPRPGKYKP